MSIIVSYAQDNTSIVVSTLIKRVGFIMNDEDHVRWTTDELLEWINEGVIATINANPAAGERDATLTLQLGARQELDGSVCQLMALVCNVDQNGNPGRSISRTDLSLMSLAAPEWQNGKASKVVRQYMFDERSPSVFYVYPPVEEGVKVRASMASIPDQLTNAADIISINIEYVDALLNYVCYRCAAKDSEYANGGIASAYYGAYQTALGNESAGAQSTSPNRNRA